MYIIFLGEVWDFHHICSLLFHKRLRTSELSYIYPLWVPFPPNHHCAHSGFFLFCQDPKLLSECWCVLHSGSTQSINVSWLALIFNYLHCIWCLEWQSLADHSGSSESIGYISVGLVCCRHTNQSSVREEKNHSLLG